MNDSLPVSEASRRHGGRRLLLAKTANALAALFIILFVATLAVSCSKDSGDDGGGGSGGGVNGTWKGTAQSGYLGKVAFTATIAENNTVLSGTITVTKIGIENESLTGTYNGSEITFGDISGYISFSGTVDGDSASGIYDYASIETGPWTAAHQ
jgi:hypothetical protein